MDYPNRIAQCLHEYQKKDHRLTGWRFDLHQSQGLEIGVKNNRIGGPYSPPSYKQGVGGEIYLIWEDAYFTSAKLDASTPENFREYMDLWKATRYHDADGVGLYRPEAIPEVPLCDAKAETVSEHDFDSAFQLLTRGLNEIKNAGIAKVDAKLKCFMSHRYLWNSEGLTLYHRQTPVEFYFVANDSYGQGYMEKHWPSEAEFSKAVWETARVGKLLEKPASTTLSGPVTLILPPETLESLTSHFLMTNLSGNLVANRQSCFTAEDFRNHRQVLRDDLEISVDPLLPYRSFSYHCTAEAVPAKSQRFINQGRLITPVLNLKYAKKLGMEPTAIPGGGFFIKSSRPIESWEEMVKTTERGLILYSVLGLHTQDASSGLFSLTADQCLLVEQGQIAGKVKAVVNGDFIRSLRQEESRFCHVTGEDNPGYAFMANALT